MVRHLAEVARSVLRWVRPKPGDLVLDIGSNDGTLLSCYPADGPDLVGIDPTARKFKDHYKPHIQVIPALFSASGIRRQYGSRRAKIVTSIAMFYDLERPLEFMAEVRDVLAEDGVWLLEQSYLPAMLAANAYDTICHEHVEYYALRQVIHMAELTGLKVIDVRTNDVNGGSFAVTLARKESAYASAEAAVASMLRAEADAGLSTQAPYERFRGAVLAHREMLPALLRGFRAQGQLVLGYGASTKGNVILQFSGLTATDLPAIAEVNEDKFGCYTPGSRIPIIPEAEAHSRAPDAFLVLPWHFRSNLLEREQPFLAQGGRMIFPLPRIEVVR
jgi:NDP-4-keto-2,6-dideoxyhexose 3-C-methyltransferase